MKRLIPALCLVVSAVFFITSCATTDSAAPQDKTTVQETPAPPPVQESVPTPQTTDEEYARSTSDVQDISREDFEADKRAILEIISRLSVVMDKYDYEEWLTYIDPDSINYWKNPRNLSKASLKLPVKGLKLNNLRDYFNYVFIPSRKTGKIDEIRYISHSEVKAVQVNGETDVIYYNFRKINGKWLVSIPPL